MKKIKRFSIVFVLVIALLISMVVPASAALDLSDEYWNLIDIINELTEENRRLQDEVNRPTTPAPVHAPLPHLVSPTNLAVSYGQVMEVELSIRNIGTGRASNLLTQAQTSAGAPFIVEFVDNSNNISTINQGQTRTMTLRITVDANAATGNHTINLTHRFRDEAGNNESTTDTINVRVTGVPEEDEPLANIRLVNLRTTAGVLGADESFTVTADLQNIGDARAENVQISISNLGAATIFLTSDLNQAFFSTLEPGQTRQVSFTLHTSRNITSSTHAINFRVAYDGVATGRPDIPFFVNVHVPQEDETDTNVRLTNIRTTAGVLGADERFEVTADLTNIGDAPAENIQISIPNLSAATIFLVSDLNQAFFPTLAPGQTRQVSFTLHTSRNIASNTYPINFRVSYDGVAEGRPDIPFFVNVFAADDEADVSPNIELRRMTATTTRLNVGQTGQISFELVNTGDAVARNINVAATSLVEGALVPTTSSRISVQSLGIGESRTFTFSFMPTSQASTQSYPIRFNIDYTLRGAEESLSFMQFAALNVFNPEPEPTPTPDDDEQGNIQIPRVIVASHPTYPLIPRAGESFEMEITFLNTSSTRSVNNIRITLASALGEQGAGAVFTPIGGSNTLFVDYLAPRGMYTKVITMHVLPAANPGIHTLTVHFDYQDYEFHSYEASEQLNIPVAQLSRLEIYPPEPFIMPFMDMWGFVDVEFQVLNTGRTPIDNVWVRVEGPFDTHEANVFMSSLQPQRTNTYIGRIRPLEPGLHEGYIRIFGEDGAGDIIEIIHPFSIEVMGGFDEGFGDEFGDPWGEGGAFERPGFEFGDPWDDDPWGEEEEQGFFSRIWGFIRRPWFWIPLGLVVVAAVVVAVILIKHKNSRLDFDEN